MLKYCLAKLMQRENLTTLDCQQAFTEMLDSAIEPVQVGAFLALLRAKPETAEELAAIVVLLRQRMRTVSTPHKVLDIVGTGGDGTNSVNISTGSAILAASCGVKVAKHGNRAVSSLAGSADVLEALGINIQLNPAQIAASIAEIGIGFCFSPNFHPAMQKLRSVRQQLGLPTTFNLIGPLLNPANASYIILGTLNEKLLPLMAAVLQQTGCERAMVVHGGGLDEISCVGPATIIEVTPTTQINTALDPKSYGFTACSVADLRGGDAATNAQLLLQAFSGKRSAIADSLILNAATALYLTNAYGSIAEAIPYVSDSLLNGAALKLLNNWIEFSNDQQT